MLTHFLAGAVTFGYFVIALFFLRFWRLTRDELFLAFGMAFTLLGIAQALTNFADVYLEERAWAYLVRLGAFSLIIGAIIRKNREVG